MDTHRFQTYPKLLGSFRQIHVDVALKPYQTEQSATLATWAGRPWPDLHSAKPSWKKESELDELNAAAKCLTWSGGILGVLECFLEVAGEKIVQLELQPQAHSI